MYMFAPFLLSPKSTIWGSKNGTKNQKSVKIQKKNAFTKCKKTTKKHLHCQHIMTNLYAYMHHIFVNKEVQRERERERERAL